MADNHCLSTEVAGMHERSPGDLDVPDVRRRPHPANPDLAVILGYFGPVFLCDVVLTDEDVRDCCPTESLLQFPVVSVPQPGSGDDNAVHRGAGLCMLHTAFLVELRPLEEDVL